MLTTEEFHAWCQRLHLPKETEELIASIRSSPPVRKVRGRANNVAGRYPSPKMQRSIQFESQHVELWAIYAMERDDEVLEYYEQPTRVPLQYRARSGRNTTQWHTPDFLVLRKTGASFEEWKPAQALESLEISMPNRYQRDGGGKWRCPPGEAWVQPLGLSYQLRSSAEYHPLSMQNVQFLQDYWAHPVPSDPEQERLLLSLVDTHPGIRLTEAKEAYPDLSVDIVWALIATRRLFTDLTATSLMRHDQVALFRTEEAIGQVARPPAIVGASRSAPLLLIWDHRLFQADVQGESVTLQPDAGEALLLSSAQFGHLLEHRELTVVSAATPSPTSQQIREALTRAGPQAQQAANERLRQIVAYVRGEKITVTPRSVQRWMAAYRKAETVSGCGYLGLLDQVAARGNRSPRAPEASMQLLHTYLKDHYATPQAKRAAAVYHLYRQACTREGIPPVSERTFYRERARFTTPEVTTQRLGRRAAYAQLPFFWYLDQTTPRHGERPFALAHLDHTELDVLLVSSLTGKPLAKPWATMLTDANTRRILALYVSYESPSYRSAMMTLRACVQRHQRLPQALVVDRGPDFGSVYFETLLSRYFITKKERPAQQPRFGSVLERLFGTSTTEFLNQLRGNTQASKTPRQMTREVDPQRLAVWTLERFAARFSQWAYDVYDQMEHPALGQSPREAFTQGMRLSGARLHRLIPFSEEFIMLTRPTTRTGEAKVHPARGITVNHLHYWHERMRQPALAGKRVPVRYEPYDMGVVYLFLEGQWLECLADDYALVHGRSEQEWELILEEWREQQRQHGQKRITINGPLLAEFLEEVAAEEQLLLQRQRDLEEQSIREAILGKRNQEPGHLLPLTQQEEDEFDELDLAAIPRYEEYR
jgi:putative transposase